MARYFEVRVNQFSSEVHEVFKPLARYDWRGAVDGVSVEYVIKKDSVVPPKNWFERGTIEVQYHAKNISQTGFVAWQTMSRKPRRQGKKAAQIKAKMEKLL